MAGLCRPELPHARAAGRHGFGKGPFYADVGGFGALANDHIRLVDTLPNQISLSAGTLGEEEGFLGGTHTFASGDRLIAAADYEHLDGPWTHSDNFHKIAGALRFLHGAEDDGYSLTALYYWGHTKLTTDQPERAVSEGLIKRFGSSIRRMARGRSASACRGATPPRAMTGISRPAPITSTVP